MENETNASALRDVLLEMSNRKPVQGMENETNAPALRDVLLEMANSWFGSDGAIVFVQLAAAGVAITFALHSLGHVIRAFNRVYQEPEATEAENTIQYEMAKLEEYNTKPPSLRQIKRNDRKANRRV